MIDELALGTRDKRGDWTPNRRVAYGPLFAWPPKPGALLRWMIGFPGYLGPWNAFYCGLAVAAWFFTTPATHTMSRLSPGWIAVAFLRNAALVIGWYGLFHWRLYSRKAQGNRFKYNGKGLADRSDVFTFGSQLRDNMFWTLASGVTIWSAYEVITLWLFARGSLNQLAWSRNPVWFVVLLLLIPLMREFHFYCVHRFIHWPPMYKRVHSLHHRNTNPGPWSGLSMHPVEHVLYFSGVFVHWLMLSHPIHALFHLLHAALSPVPGHTGYEKIEVGSNLVIDTNCLAHYLHHKHFEVNYADGSIPLDRWFGTFHDGSPEADTAMQQRFKARQAARSTS